MLSYSSIGAQILRASMEVGELLYLSSLSDDFHQKQRGGVPVIFPQFADFGPLQKHGFVRDLSWLLLEDIVRNDSHTLLFGLHLQADNQPNWPHKAMLMLSIRMLTNELYISLSVQNTGNSQFAWTGGLHPYIHTADLCASQLHGLQGSAVHDRYDSTNTIQNELIVRWSGQEFERLYDTRAKLKFETPDKIIHIGMSGFDQWMVWNPGIAGAKAIRDLPDQDWKHFICIEPVCVSRPNVLKPGEVFEGGLEIVVRPSSR